MFFDEQVGKVKADPFSLESLIAWLEKQPRAKRYCYMDNGGCLMHQYFTHAGFDVEWVGGWRFRTSDKNTYDLSLEFSDIAAALGPGPRGLTFGAALDRAKAALALVSDDCRAPQKGST